MDWDEPKKEKKAAVVGEDLSQHSIEDLKTRVQELQSEIARVEQEVEKRAGQLNSADAIFKRS